MVNYRTVAVLGGGNGAFAAAADLKNSGFSVRLLEAPELVENIKPVREKGGIELEAGDVLSVRPGYAPLDVVTHEPQKALQGASVVLYVVPAFAECRFTQLCAPYFQPNQLVVLFCGNFGGALELATQLSKGGMESLPLIAETEGLVYGAIKTGPTTVRVIARKKGLKCAAFPSARTAEALERLRPFFSDFVPASSVLETGLRGLNPIIHPAISVLNAGRTATTKPQWRYYRDGVTEAVAYVVEQVDRERLEVARALALELPSALDVLRSWYGSQSIPANTLGEFLANNPAYHGIWAPQTLNHRFITEDVPFGLVPMESVGVLTGMKTPITGSIITLSSQLLATNFRTSGRNPARLGLHELDVTRLKRLVLGD